MAFVDSTATIVYVPLDSVMLESHVGVEIEDELVLQSFTEEMAQLSSNLTHATASGPWCVPPMTSEFVGVARRPRDKTSATSVQSGSSSLSAALP